MAETVLVSLPTPDVVREVACGPDGIVRGRAIRTFVDLSTTGAVESEEIAATLGAAGVAHVDAPVSGGVAGLRGTDARGDGLRCARGVRRVRPLLETFGANVFHVGSRPRAGSDREAAEQPALGDRGRDHLGGARRSACGAGLDPATLLEIFNAASGRNTATSDKFPRHVLTRRVRLRVPARR